MTDLELLSLIGEDGVWFGIQGRSMAVNATLRYITVMFEDRLKLFGQDHVNPEKQFMSQKDPSTVFIRQETVAMCGSDVALQHSTLSR